MSTVSYKPTYKDTSTRTHTHNTAKRPSYTSSLLLFIYLIYQHTRSFSKTSTKISHGFFTISDIMKSFQPAPTLTTSVWGNFENPAEVNHLSPVHPRAPGRSIILLQCHTTTLLKYFPPKIFKPVNVSLFDILPMDFLAVINNWLISLKNHDKYKNILS